MVAIVMFVFLALAKYSLLVFTPNKLLVLPDLLLS